MRLGEVVSLRKGSISPAEVPNARYIGLEHIDSGEIRIRRFSYAAETKSAKAVFQSGVCPPPTPREQREITHILQAVDEKIRAEEGRKAALEALFKALLHHRMTAQQRLPPAAVRGQVPGPVRLRSPGRGRAGKRCGYPGGV